MADYNVKEIAFGGNNYKMYPANLTSETHLNNAAQDATETQDRVYPVRMDANGKLAVNVPWTDSGGSGPTEEIAKLKSDLGIVEDTDIATHAIAKGQYVIWHGELYTASSAISIGNALSLSNLTAVSGGGLNELSNNTPEVVTNSNGTAYKFPNGVMICTKRWTGNIAITATWGSSYEASSPVSLGKWAVEFIAKPIVSIMNTGANAGWPGRLIDASTSNIGKVSPVRPSTLSSSSFTFDITGIGMWK